MSHRAGRLTGGIIPWLAMLGIVVGATSAAAQGYSHDARTVVVEFSERLGEVGEDDQPWLRIHGDGRVLVHYPRYMKRAGDYTAQLSRSEMDDLVQSLIAKGVPDFDADTVRARKRDLLRSRRAAAEQGQPVTVTHSSDPDVTRIELRLETGARSVTWSGLREDARDLPGLAPVQGLAAAAQELRTLRERPDLVEID